MRPTRASADVAIEDAAAAHCWFLSRIEHRPYRNVFGRGDARLIVGFRKTGRAVDVGLCFPSGCGTTFVVDPTPFSTRGRAADKLDTALKWLTGPATDAPLGSTLVLVPCAAK